MDQNEKKSFFLRSPAFSRKSEGTCCSMSMCVCVRMGGCKVNFVREVARKTTSPAMRAESPGLKPAGFEDQHMEAVLRSEKVRIVMGSKTVLDVGPA
jgi:hypothetical protein